MHIYKITNLVNGKIYIGRTINKNANRRWRQHVNASMGNRCDMYICKAIRSYGEENFIFEVIDSSASNNEELAILETQYIIFYDCLAPKGYNMEAYQDGIRSLLKEVRSEMSKKAQSHKGRPRLHNLYKGVFRVKRKTSPYITGITHEGRKYQKAFKSEIKSAITYDKVALFLFGEDAEINFPCKRYKWLKRNLKKFFEWFSSKEPFSSKYKGVTWSKNHNRWQAVLYKYKKYKFVLAYCNTELEAAYIRDSVVRKLDLKTEFNFEELPKEYLDLDINRYLNKKDYKYSKFVGVSYDKNCKKFKAMVIYQKIRYFLGYFSEETHANQAVLDKRRELGII